MSRERDPKNEWLWAVALTPEELQQTRLEAVSAWPWDAPPEKYTCDECALALRCSLAFDSYNTDGDCLYEK